MSGDQTQRADEVAAVMRGYFEAHRPFHWWQRRSIRDDCLADNLMLGLLRVALHEWSRRA